jgi:CRISPR-associated protein Csm2
MPRTNLDGVQDLSKLTPEDIDSIGDNFGHKLADKSEGIKTNQVRNVFASVSSLRTKLRVNNKWNDEIRNELVLLKPKLAYAAGRQKNVRVLYELLSKGIQATLNSENKEAGLKNFIQMVEAIVAYHKFYGGKD